MRTLIIEAASPDSARDFQQALTAFQTELLQSEDGVYQVKVTLGGEDREIITLLNTIEAHISQRRDGPARLDLDGNSYTMHPQRASSPPEPRRLPPR